MRVLRLVLIFYSYCFAGLVPLYSQGKISTEEYIERYKDVAISEMYRTGIPASITLAQGILESGSGNSRLALEANNHFGIKCHEWNGDYIREDDDARQECFRKYEDAIQSYIDHSEFLMSRSRYAFLFDFSSTDYKRWAHGLKKAGYATNPKYPQILISLIDRYNLHQFDNAENPRLAYNPGPLLHDPVAADNKKEGHSIYPEGILENNRIKFVYLQHGETVEDIARKMEIPLSRLRRYNELTEGHQLHEGDKIYLQAKRKKGAIKKYRVQEGDNIYSISQRFGVKTTALYQRNLITAGYEPLPGEILYLRGKRHQPPKLMNRQEYLKFLNKEMENKSIAEKKQESKEVKIIAKVDTVEPVRTTSIEDPYSDLKEEKAKYLYPDQKEGQGKKKEDPINKGIGVDKETWLYHTVESGQTLYAISKMYDVGIEELKRWNHLKDNTIKTGQTLIVGKSE